MYMAFTARKINLETLVITTIFFLNTSWWFLDRTLVPSFVLSALKLCTTLLALVVLNIRIRRKIVLHWPFFLAIGLYYMIGNVSGLFNLDLPILSKVVPTGLTFFLNILILLTVQKNNLLSGYQLYFYLFILLVVLSFIEYVFLILGVDRNYQIHNLNFRELEYRRYWILIVCDWLVYPIGGLNITRFNGPFEEPGNLGTYGGILIWINWILSRRSSFLNIILFSFSMSFAYFYSLLIYYFYALKSRARIIISILTVGLGILLFPLTNYFIFARYNDGGIIGLSRGQFIDKWQVYLESESWLGLLFGHGFGSNMLMSQAQFASYHKFIVESGLVGFLLLCLGFIYLFLKSKELTRLLFGLVLVGLIWQRPEFSSGPYLAALTLVYLTKEG